MNGVWLEEPSLARDATFIEALAAGVRRMMTFLDSERVDASALITPRIRSALAALSPARARRMRA